MNVSPEALQVVAALEAEAPATRSSAAPARAVAPRPADEAYVSWIGRIEAAKGPAKRRALVEAALRELAGAEYRDKVLVEAARIEVYAALDKSDGLKTRAAKLRTLRAALEMVRADAVPDELQAQEIALLDDAIREAQAG